MTYFLQQGGMLLEWSTIITGVGSVLLALMVFFAAERKPSNIYFSLMAITLGLISVANYFSVTSTDSESSTLFWIRAVMFLVPFVMTFLYGFGISYENKYYKYKRNRGLIIGALCAVIAIISVTPITYKSISFAADGSIIPETGFGLILVGLFILPLFITSIVAMVINAHKADPLPKRKINIALYLFILSFGVQIVTSFILVVAFNYTSLVPLGNFLSLIYIAAITISILQYKIININIISSSAFVVILMIVLFADIFSVSSTQEIIYRIIVFLATSFIGYQFIKAIIVDAKRKKELEYYSKELQILNKRLKEIDAMKTEFVSMASHELLTPISAIEGYLSMLVDEKLARVDDPKAMRFIENVYSSSKRLARLVGDLLNVSRIEQGRLLTKKEVVNIDSLVNAVITELKFRAQEKHMTLVPDFKINGVAANTYADADKVKEVLVNLCGNSIKYTKDGGKIVVSVLEWPTNQVLDRYNKMAGHLKNNGHTGAIQKIVNDKFTHLVGAKQLVIAVSDNGIGIAPGDICKLFQKFSRVGDWSTQEVQGTGLGLYISRALVEMHHGRIWAESAGEGKGTIFYFSLPEAAAQAQIQQLDGQVPQAKDAKPLARMGGGPAAKV